MNSSFTQKTELHCHSNQGLRVLGNLLYDSCMSVPDILQLALKRHISILAITDHNTLAGTRQAIDIIHKNHLPILLIPGCEISSKDGHILAYGINQEIRHHQSAFETIRQIHAQKGLAAAAHPFFFYGVGKKILELDFDLVEGFNASMPSYFNEKARKAAKQINKPFIAASDAHYFTEIGRSTVTLPASTRTLAQALQSLRRGKFNTLYRPTPLSTFPQYLFHNIRTQFTPDTPNTNRFLYRLK